MNPAVNIPTEPGYCEMGVSFQMLLVTSSVGALQSAFFGVYLFTLKKGRNLANILLGLLLLAFAIRVFKSVGYYFSEGHVIPNVLMNFGFGTNLAIMPLLWLYLNAFLKDGYTFNWKRDLIHLIPAILVLILSPFLTDHFWLRQSGYTISLLSMLAYLPFCIYLVFKNFKQLPRIKKLWTITLLTGVTIVWFGYLANFVFGLVPYITGPVLFSFLVYFLSFLGFREGSLFTRDARYQKSTYTTAQIDTCFEDLVRILDSEKLYKDVSLTLPGLAGKLGVAPNLLSETINKKADQNFSDFINRRRVCEAKELLKIPAYRNQKIASIAFETGFNSLSVFNAAFKKFTSQTPSAYRKEHEDI